MGRSFALLVAVLLTACQQVGDRQVATTPQLLPSGPAPALQRPCASAVFLSKFKYMQDFDYTQDQSSPGYTAPAQIWEISNPTPSRPPFYNPDDARFILSIYNSAAIPNNVMFDLICSNQFSSYIALYANLSPRLPPAESFAFWPSRKQHTKTPVGFIGIPYQTIRSLQGVPQTVGEEEVNAYLGVLRPDPNAAISVWTSLDPPPGAPAQEFHRQMAFLAQLSHEMGHLVWHYANGHPARSCPDRRKFVTYDWQTGQEEQVNPQGGNGYHELGHTFNSHYYPGDPSIDAIVEDVGSGTYSSLQQLLYNGHFASLLAAVAPDDDFAETYKFKILNTISPNFLESISLGNQPAFPFSPVKTPQQDCVAMIQSTFNITSALELREPHRFAPRRHRR
jgi:hypothetical protein